MKPSLPFAAIVLALALNVTPGLAQQATTTTGSGGRQLEVTADNGSAHQTDLRFFFFKQIHQDRSVGQ